MNNVILIGRLTRDPEVRNTNSDLAIANFSLAVDRIGECTDYIRCVGFGKTAEFAVKYLHKGMKIAVSGRIQTGSYQDKDGKTVYTTDVVIDRCEFCEPKSSNQNQSKADEYATIPEGSDDDLPFNF